MGTSVLEYVALVELGLGLSRLALTKPRHEDYNALTRAAAAWDVVLDRAEDELDRIYTPHYLKRGNVEFFEIDDNRFETFLLGMYICTYIADDIQQAARFHFGE